LVESQVDTAPPLPPVLVPLPPVLLLPPVVLPLPAVVLLLPPVSVVRVSLPLPPQADPKAAAPESSTATAQKLDFEEVRMG
jgi:hypothetical protein